MMHHANIFIAAFHQEIPNSGMEGNGGSLAVPLSCRAAGIMATRAVLWARQA